VHAPPNSCRPPTCVTGQPQPAATPSGWWDTWFWRLVQICGLGLVIYEARFEHADRPWLLLVAVAMMLGGLGAQFVLRWILGRIE
jgi:hypothetical protein